MFVILKLDFCNKSKHDSINNIIYNNIILCLDFFPKTQVTHLVNVFGSFPGSLLDIYAQLDSDLPGCSVNAPKIQNVSMY